MSSPVTSIVFRISSVRKLLDVLDAPLRHSYDNGRIWVWKPFQNFSGPSESSSSQNVSQDFICLPEQLSHPEVGEHSPEAGRPKDRALLDKFSETVYECIVIFFSPLIL